MLSRGHSTLAGANPSAPSTTGIFSGLLGSASSAALEQRIRDLSQELTILQEELESKINENERLVIESSDVKRVRWELEQKVELLETEVQAALNQKRAAVDDLERMRREKIDVVTKVEAHEINLDGLRRELVLKSEHVRKLTSANEALQLQFEQVSLQCAELSNELNESKTVVLQTNSKLDCLKRDYDDSESEKLRLSSELFSERAKQESLNLRIDQLEDEIAILATHKPIHGRVTSDGSSSATIPPGCEDALPCCPRAEYFLAKLKTADEAIRKLKGAS
jgi:chromosome segregation ATPase